MSHAFRHRSWIIAGLATVSLQAGQAYAAPTIQSVSGSATQGGSITIVGSGFGTKAAAAPKVWDTVDNQPSYVQGLTGTLTTLLSSLVGKSVPEGTGYVYHINSFNDPGSAVFAQTNLRHPFQKMNYRTTNYRGYMQWPESMGAEHVPPTQNEIYVSFWFRPDSSIDVEGHSSKFIRIWDEGNGTGTRISWTQMHLTAANSAGYDGGGWANWGGKTGQWNRLELFVSAPKGVIKAWTNGRLIHNYADFKKDPNQTDKGLGLARLGWDPGGNLIAQVNSNFGDVYVDSTQARVELCNQATWAECLVREVQPATSWSNGQIAFTLQQGSLSSSLPLYVYVVDADGNANANGVKLNSTAVVPQPPSGVIVN